jgi:hypothetical protein
MILRPNLCTVSKKIGIESDKGPPDQSQLLIRPKGLGRGHPRANGRIVGKAETGVDDVAGRVVTSADRRSNELRGAGILYAGT